ncbi:GbsR/MarR family transcriptional regulator [Portibacter lacus]|uniref:MarR family transcriptional regulator n=1 Tax=Portibacter lacus TaxID=1099794 RepID=A0AA37SX87_9BACT|nr:MarR family transcriptional regulator [Portibacter lacus]GLR19473.1 hypothetical protein GCM10007940_40890 [Portibacter lacus]
MNTKKVNMVEEKKISKEELVEKMGIHFEQSGLTPLHGRVFAYLLLAEPSHKDFFEIQEFLKASKSAISNAIKFLLDKEMITYITFSGDRRRYFKVNLKGWKAKMKKDILAMSTMISMLGEVLSHKNVDKEPEFVNEITDFRNVLLDIQNIFKDYFKEKG